MHQQIYGWRHAVNSLEKVDYKTFHLSTSFRFSQDSANLGMEILKWKNHLDKYKPLTITGIGKSKQNKVKAVLARTNLGLLLRAIEFVTEKNGLNSLYFEGNFNSYTYADDGASLYDILHLYNGKNRLIRDKLIREMKDLEELEDYIKKTEDVQLSLMIEIVRKYGNDIPNLLKKIKDRHVENDEKDKADMIFSTVHRCKGMEYDSIHIVNDFISEKKLEKLKKEDKKKNINIAKLNEEINLLYVAVTRAKNTLYIPEELMPKDFPLSPHIHKIMKENKEDKSNKFSPKTAKTKTPSPHRKEKTYSLEKLRVKHNAAYKKWTDELDNELTNMYYEGINRREISTHFGRTKSAIQMRIRKLELDEF